MNILAALFGIFRKRGLVTTLKEGRSLTSFFIFAVIFSVVGGVLYGYAMGIGMGTDVALKDAIKVGLIFALSLLFSLPIFWVSYRLLGREERLGQVSAIPLTMMATVSVVLAVTSPVVFMLSVLAGFSPDAIYIHIVIVDLAVLVGLYLAGTLAYQSFSDHKNLVIPNVVGFLLMGVIIVVLMNFMGPFLAPYSGFSVGVDRLQDGLGIGVAEKVENGLTAANKSERMFYHFQTYNQNGELEQDYSIFRTGADYLIEVHLHAVPGDEFQNDVRIWILDGSTYTDFDDGFVSQVDAATLSNYLDNSLQPEVYTMPGEFADANWRAVKIGNTYTATGTTATLSQATIKLEAASGRLTQFTLGSAETAALGEVRVFDIAVGTMDHDSLAASLAQASAAGTTVGVTNRVEQSLAAAIAADRVSYRFQTTNDNADLVQDYTVTRVGADYLIEVHLHALPGDVLQEDRRIWIIADVIYNDFSDGFVKEAQGSEMDSYLAAALPSSAYRLPDEFSSADWRALQSGGEYIATGTTLALSQITLRMDNSTGRLSELVIGSAEVGINAETRVFAIAAGDLDLAELQASLNKAIVVGSVDRFNASMQDYVQDEAFFVVRFPRNWRAGSWSRSQQNVTFTAACPSGERCAALTVSVFDLAEGKGAQQFAEDLAGSLELQPEYRKITLGVTTFGDQTVGVVEYLFDQVVGGEIETTQHVEYIFVGQISRYHLDFSGPASSFGTFLGLFKEIAALFTYLR